MRVEAGFHSIRKLFPKPRVLFAQLGAFGLERYQIAVRIGMLFHSVKPLNAVWDSVILLPRSPNANAQLHRSGLPLRSITSAIERRSKHFFFHLPQLLLKLTIKT